MKTSKSLFSFLILAAAAHLGTSTAQAATYYWDSNGNVGGFGSANGIWGSSAFWSTNVLGGSTANTTILATDDVNFGTAANAYTGTVTLNAARNAYSMTFGGTGAVNFIGDSASRAITIGNGGITLAPGAGAVTFGNGTAINNVTFTLANGAQTWTNLSANNLTINNTAASFTRASGATLTFNQASTGVFSMSTTVLPNDASGIVGPWSFFGTGTSQRYSYNNAGTIAGYSGGIAAADVEAFTSATTNYDFSSTGTTTLTTNRTAHTARYTGTGNIIDLGASGTNTLTLNGLLAVGPSGTMAIKRTGGTGSLAIGSTNELVIAGTQNIDISAPITGTATQALTYAGTGILTLSGTNTYGGATATGATTIASGTLIVSGGSAIANSGLVTLGNVKGATFQLNTSETIGNLSGGGTMGGVVALGGNTLTVGDATATTTYAGTFTGTSASSIVKQGSGILIFSNATSIPGTLIINAGTAQVATTRFSGGTITLNANNVALYASAGTVTGSAGLAQTTISNNIDLSSSVTTTGASIYTAGAGRWNFTGNITGGATSGSQTLKFDSRAGTANGGDRTSTLFSGVISNGIGGGALNLSLNITPQSSGSASNEHPTNVSLSGINTFTGTLTATRGNTGAASWLTIGGERWTDGGFGLNTPTYGRMGTGYLGGNNGGDYTSAINFSSSANQIVNLNYFSSANQTWSGVIGGGGNSSGALVKEGSGTLTLTNQNLYSSLTTIGGGKLLLGFNNATPNILPSTTVLWMGLGRTYAPITTNRATIISGGGGGGTLELAGSHAGAANQTVASLTTAANTTSSIVLGANRTLTITSGAIQAGASHATGTGNGSFPATISTGGVSGLNFNTAAGGADALTSTIGTSIVQFGSAVTGLTSGFTVTDSTGFGLATTNGSNQIIRNTSTTLLPAAPGATPAVDYRIDNNAGGSGASGSSSLAITSGTNTTRSITVDTTAASGSLTIGNTSTATTLGSDTWNFGGNGSNTYSIDNVASAFTGTGVQSTTSAGAILINNFNTGAVTFNSPILANGASNALVVGGTGTIALNGVNTFVGTSSVGITINSGNLQIGGAGQLTSGTYAGIISINGGSVLRYSSSAAQTLSGIISGAGGLTKDTNNSVLTLSATNLYTGPTTVNAGTLRAGAAAGGQAFGGGSAVTLANTSGVTLDLNNFSQTIGSLAGGGTTGGNVTLGSGTLTTGGNNASTSYGGVISGTTGGLIKNGIGNFILSGTNTFTGGVTINAGALQLGSAGALNSTAGSQNAVAFGAASTGTLALAGNSAVIANLSTNATPGTTFVQNANGSSVSNAVLTVGNSTNQSGTYAGIIQDGTGGGTMSLTKAGTGTLTLSGTNTYSGDTNVSAGKLYVTGALNNSSVTVDIDGTIGSNGANGILGNGLTILAGGSLDLTGANLVANSDSSGILSLTGDLTLGDFTFQDIIGWDWENAAAGTYELIDGTFDIDFGNTEYISEETAYVFVNGLTKGYFIEGSLKAVIVAIPEPSTALLGGLGLMALLRRRRRA